MTLLGRSSNVFALFERSLRLLRYLPRAKLDKRSMKAPGDLLRDDFECLAFSLDDGRNSKSVVVVELLAARSCEP